MKGFYALDSGAIQGHHGPPVSFSHNIFKSFYLGIINTGKRKEVGRSESGRGQIGRDQLKKRATQERGEMGMGQIDKGPK